jgi:asparagine synthase (glutamine-hydrolysing)
MSMICICGAFNLDKRRAPLDAGLIARMAGAPPESMQGGKGVLVCDDGRAVMACVSTGRHRGIDDRHSPQMSADGRICAVWTGVLTMAEGHSDVEIRQGNPAKIVADLFAKRGGEAVSNIEGEYAFVAVDRDKGEIYLVRDRCGLKQLYYAVDDKTCYFSTRIEPLLRVLPARRKLNERALYHMLTLGGSPPPMTMFEGISTVAPGHYAVINSDGVVANRFYWGPWLSCGGKAEAEDLVGELRERLRRAVQRRLEDGKIGVFLSGGLDSSAIVALVKAQVDRDIHTYTVTLDNTWGALEADYDEAAFARLVAKKFGTVHHEMRLGSREYFDGIRDAIRILEVPAVASEMGMVNALSRVAEADGIELLFNGEGSDIILFGSGLYGTVLKSMQGRWKRISKFPRFVHRIALALMRLGLGGHPDRWAAFSTRWVLYNLSRGFPMYCGKAYSMPEVWKRQLFSRSFLARHRGEDSYDYLEPYVRMIAESAADAPEVDRMMCIDFPFWLGEVHNVEHEKIAGACGLNVRSPFYDQSILRLSLSAPLDVKLREDGTTKYLLRMAMDGILPHEIIWRRKVGFSTPAENWLRRNICHSLREAFHDSPLSKEDIIDEKRLAHLLSLHDENKVDFTWQFLALYVVAQWMNHWLDNNG